MSQDINDYSILGRKDDNSEPCKYVKLPNPTGSRGVERIGDVFQLDIDSLEDGTEILCGDQIPVDREGVDLRVPVQPTISARQDGSRIFFTRVQGAAVDALVGNVILSDALDSPPVGSPCLGRVLTGEYRLGNWGFIIGAANSQWSMRFNTNTGLGTFGPALVLTNQNDVGLTHSFSPVVEGLHLVDNNNTTLTFGYEVVFSPTVYSPSASNSINGFFHQIDVVAFNANVV